MTVRRAALVLPAAALVLLTGCGTEAQDDAAPGDEPVVSIQTSQPSAGAAPASPPPAAPSPSARVIEVTLEGGTVTGVSSRVEVALGERLIIRVTSDVADEVHVHGYDERAAVPAGETVDIPLTADIPGGFEVELEETGRLLFQLRVA